MYGALNYGVFPLENIVLCVILSQKICVILSSLSRLHPSFVSHTKKKFSKF